MIKIKYLAFAAILGCIALISAKSAKENFTSEKECTKTAINHSYNIGTIEVQRAKGTEIWNITSGNLSIDKPIDRYRLNFWVESDADIIKTLDDTGKSSLVFEIKLPFKQYPTFKKKWKYKHADFKFTVEEDYGDGPEDGYWDNLYFYEHDSLEKIEMEIKQDGDEYHIKVTGERDDPINWKYGRATYIITACMKLDEFNSYWTK